jgi:HK97 family phage prohead protease
MNNQAMLDEFLAVSQWRAINGAMDTHTFIKQKEAAERSPTALLALWQGLYDYSDSGSQCFQRKYVSTLERLQGVAEMRFKSGNDGGPETLTFYGATWNNVDRQNDICAPHCVVNCAEFCDSGVILLGHDMSSLPVASPVSCVNDSVGMLVTAFWHTTQAARDAKAVVRERLRKNKKCSCSIGYMVNSERYESLDGQRVRILESINVYEISLVNLPANDRATIIAA